MAGKIFVNYRRDDVPGDARGVCDGLAQKFGRACLFMDVDNLLVGQRFDVELAKALDACDVLIAVLGPRWMDLLRARQGGSERDYVREEIAAALKRGIVVIPVRVGRDGAMPALPRAEDLPEDIRELVLYQKIDVAHERFRRDIAELTRGIVDVRKARVAGTAKGGGRGWVAGLVALGLVVLGAGSYLAAHFVGVAVPWPPKADKVETIETVLQSPTNLPPGTVKLTREALLRFTPTALDGYVSALTEKGDAILAGYGINANAMRLCHFLAQMSHESAGFSLTTENLNYSSRALRQVWPQWFPTEEAAKPYVNNPEKLANFVYGGRMGNINPGDGFLYRGRGLIQFAGRTTYRDIGQRLGVDLEGQPDLAADPTIAFRAAAEFWKSRGGSMNSLADANDIEHITKLIKGDFYGLDDRRARFGKCWSIWGSGKSPSAD